MSRKSSKKLNLDTRRAPDIERRIEALADSYDTGWHFDHERPDIGAALAHTFAGQMEGNIDRVNEILDRYHTEFVNMLDLSLLPARPASGLVIVSLLADTVKGTGIAKGTKFLTTGDDPYVFEAEHSIYVTSSELVSAFMTDLEEGTLKFVAEEGVVSPFVLFGRCEEYPENEATFYHPYLFDAAGDELFVRIRGNEEFIDQIADGKYSFCYQMGRSFVPIDDIELMEDKETFVLRMENKKNRPKFNMLKKMKEVEKSSQGLKRRHDLLKRWQAQLDKPVAQNGENRALDDGQIVNEVLNANPQDQAPIQNVNENDNAQNANGNNNAQQAGQQQGGAGGNQNRNGNFDMEAEIRRYLGENPEEDEEELREEFRKMDEEFNKAWGINNEEKAEGNQQKAKGNQQKAKGNQQKAEGNQQKAGENQQKAGENQQKAGENQQKAGENQQKADENKAKGNDQKIDEQLRELEEEVRNDEENAEENRENEQPKDDLLGAEDNAAVNAKNAALAQVFGGVSAKVGELSVKHKAELAKKKSSRFMKVLQNYMTGEAGPGKNDEQIRKMITEMQKVNPGLQQAAAITQEAVSDLINTVLIKPLYEVFGAAEIDAVQDLQTKLITEWKKPDNPVYKALLAAVQKNMPAQQNAA